jgi:pimeloyl-ACP methyl ester carboxylesterase
MSGRHEVDTTLAHWEVEEILRANASGLTPVAFVHGLWLLSSSWQPWRELFEARGYTTIAPGWPDDPATVAEAREHPEVLAHKMIQDVTDHYLNAISQLRAKPAVIGHSFGGLIAQKIAGEGASAVTVAVDNAPFKGVLPLPISSLKSSAPVLGNPSNRGKAIALSLELSSSSNMAGPTTSTTPKPSTSTTPSTSPHRVRRCFRQPWPTSTPSVAKPGWTPTNCRPNTTPASPRSNTSPTADTPSRSTTAGRTSPRLPPPSSSGSSRPSRAAAR